MAVNVLKNVRIKGISCAVPSHIKYSKEYETVIGAEATEKFINTVGIKSRHLGDGKITTSDLCYTAANDVIEKTGVERKEIDALIFLSQTPDYLAPATACVLQHRLGLSNDCLAFDINLCCSGYVYGLHTAMLHMQTGYLKKVLLLVGDTASYTCSPEDRGQMMLFGDAGSATMLEYDTNAKDTTFLLKTKGDGYKNLIIPFGGYRHWQGSYERTMHQDGMIRSDYDCYMDGAEVFKFSIMEVPKLIKEFSEKTGYRYEDADRVVFHQANMFIIKNIAKRLRIDSEKLLFSMDEYGNTGSASLPLTMCRFYSQNNEQKKIENVMICGYGIGLSLGAANIHIDNSVCNQIIYSDEVYDDHIDEILR